MANSCDQKEGDRAAVLGGCFRKNRAASQEIAINESGSSKHFQVHVITLRVSEASTYSTVYGVHFGVFIHIL